MTNDKEVFVDIMRSLIAKHGQPMVPFESRSELTYGFVDFDAQDHKYEGKCAWVVPADSVLEERSTSNFIDTLHGNESVVGMEVEGVSCECGVYSNIRLRWEATLAEAVNRALNA